MKIAPFKIFVLINLFISSLQILSEVVSAHEYAERTHNNIIEIIARGCVEEAVETSINYEVPCEDITYSLLTPAEHTVEVVEDTYSISLATTGLESSEQVNATINGVSISANYNIATGIVQLNDIMLVDGTNTIIISLTNDCSSEVVSYTVNYEGCKPPVITLSAMPAEVGVALFDYEANVTNIDNAEQLKLMRNGAPVPFTFNPVTGSIYTLDRWKVLNSNSFDTDSARITQENGTTINGFRNSIQMNIGNTETPSSNQVCGFEQKIEAQDLQHLKYGTSSAETMTLSFWVYSNKTGTYCVQLIQDDATKYVLYEYLRALNQIFHRYTLCCIISYHFSSFIYLDN